MTRVFVTLLCLSLLVGCAAAPTPGAATPGTDAAGLIVDVSGGAELKRQGWQAYAPAAFGAPVRRGDLIRVAGTSRAVIACADLHLAELTGGVKGDPCPATGSAPIVFEGALVSPTRGDQGAGDYPLVLTPRKTRMLGDRPTLRWTAAPGAASYHVSVQGAAWQTDVSGKTELMYPSDAPALEPGKSYRLVVQAGSRSSNEETGPDLGFTLLPTAEAQQVRADEEKARGLGLAPEPTLLLVANLYAAHQLYAEALQMLPEPGGATRPALARLRGDLSLAVGLLRDGENAYLLALSGSTAEDDREGEALACRGLAKVYGLLGNQDEAVRYYQQARALYEQLGDRQAVAEIDAAMK